MCAICNETNARVRKVMLIKPGYEATIDGFTWFRIDSGEFKIHPASGEPDGPGTVWVDRSIEDVTAAVVELYAN